MNEPTPQQQLSRMISGYWTSQAIYAAASLGIADLLSDGPRNVAELAEATSSNEDALFRVLRALASVGIFAEGESRHFGLTPLAEPLRSEVAGSQRALALMTGDEGYQAWGEILYTIETGKTAFDKVYGKPIFEFLSEHPEKAKNFDRAMTEIHGRETAAVLDAYDFAEIELLADIACSCRRRLQSSP